MARMSRVRGVQVMLPSSVARARQRGLFARRQGPAFDKAERDIRAGFRQGQCDIHALSGVRIDEGDETPVGVYPVAIGMQEWRHRLRRRMP